jgi:hypothetical protein
MTSGKSSPHPHNIDLHQYVYRASWPIFEYPIPSLVLATSNRMNQSLSIKVSDGIFESITRHCDALRVDKSKWVREALLRQLADEQMHFLTIAINQKANGEK